MPGENGPSQLFLLHPTLQPICNVPTHSSVVSRPLLMPCYEVMKFSCHKDCLYCAITDTCNWTCGNFHYWLFQLSESQRNLLFHSSMWITPMILKSSQERRKPCGFLVQKVYGKMNTRLVKQWLIRLRRYTCELTQPCRDYFAGPADREKSDWRLICLFSRILAV